MKSLFGLTLGFIATVAVAQSDSAEADLKRITELRQQPLTAPGASRTESIMAFSQRSAEVADLALGFLEKHPRDARRWDALLIAYQYPRSFVTAVDADKLAARARDAITVDETAKRDWTTRLDRLVADLLAAPDVSPATWQGALATRFANRLNVPAADLAANLPAARADLALLEQRFPDSPQVASSYSRLLYALSTTDPAAHLAEVERLLTHPNARVAEIARGLRAIESIKVGPMELKFTAADGREVDLAQLRGKVVLIDFWATWCGPCIAELPNVKKVYAEYHAKGFEIVGITLENPGLRPGDTLELTEAKMAAARKKLLDFCAKEEMPWPQQFDGKWWKNEVALAYSVNAIPAMFLLDQSGKLVTTSARGEKLEAELKRLLKL